MAGYDIDRSGRSPTELKRLEEKRRRARKTNGVTKTKTKTNGVTTKKVTPPKQSKFGVGSSKTIMHNGKRMANVTKDQLDNTGMTQSEYMKAWKADPTGKRPTGKRPTGKRSTTTTTTKTTPRSKWDTSSKSIMAGKVDRRGQSASGNLRAAQKESLRAKEDAAMRKRMANQPVLAGKVDRTPRNQSASSSLRAAQKASLRGKEDAAMRKRMANQPVMGGSVSRGPRSGDTSTQPVMGGKVDRTPKGKPKTETSLIDRLKRTATKAKDALSKRAQMLADEREARRKALAEGRKPIASVGMRGGGRVKVAGYKGGGRVSKNSKATSTRNPKVRGAGKAQRGVRPAKMR